MEDTKQSPRARVAASALGEIQKSIRFFRLYPHDHPFCGSSIDESIGRMNRYLEEHGALEVDVRRDGLSLAGELVLRESEQSTDLSALLFPEGVRALTIQAGVPRDELFAFVQILSAAYPEGQGEDVSFAPDLLTALWERELTHIGYRIQDPLAPAGAGADRDPALMSVADRIQELAGDLVGLEQETAPALGRGNGDGGGPVDVQRFLDELGRAPLGGQSELAPWTDPERVEEFLSTPEGEGRRALRAELSDPRNVDNLLRAAELVAWAAAQEHGGPAPEDVSRFLAGSTLDALCKKDVTRAIGLLARAATLASPRRAGASPDPRSVARLTSARLATAPALGVLAAALEAELATTPPERLIERGLRYLELLDASALAGVCAVYPTVASAGVRKMLQRYLNARVTQAPDEVARITHASDPVIVAEGAAVLASAGRDTPAWRLLEEAAARSPAARGVLDDATGDKGRRELLRTLAADADAARRMEALAVLQANPTPRAFDELAAIVQEGGFAQREDVEIAAILELLCKVGGLRAVRVLQELVGRKPLLFGRSEAQRLSTLARERLDALRNR